MPRSPAMRIPGEGHMTVADLRKHGAEPNVGSGHNLRGATVSADVHEQRTNRSAEGDFVMPRRILELQQAVSLGSRSQKQHAVVGLNSSGSVRNEMCPSRRLPRPAHGGFQRRSSQRC